MPFELLIALVGFAIASSITPGPNNLLVLTSGVNHGVVHSLALIAGISFGFAFMLVLVGIGLGSIIRDNPTIQTCVKISGLGYMLWLAWAVATSRPAPDRKSDGRNAKPLSALTGAAFQWVNPKAWAIALSATAAFSVPQAPVTSVAWIASVFIGVAFASLSAWAAFGSLMRSLVGTPSRMRMFNVAMALLLVASALPVGHDLLSSLWGAK